MYVCMYASMYIIMLYTYIHIPINQHALRVYSQPCTQATTNTHTHTKKVTHATLTKHLAGTRTRC